MMRLKCFPITLCLTIFQCAKFISTDFIKNNHSLNSFVDRKLSKEKDLGRYIKTIEVVLDYCSQNVNEIDINLSFGIFLTNVNLNHILKYKEGNIPRNIKIKLTNLSAESEKLLQFFNKLVKDDADFVNRQYKPLSFLFRNVSMWVNRLEKLVYKDRRDYNYNDLKKMYPQWSYYLKDVDDVEKWTPNPKSSDMCLVSLSVSKIDGKNAHSWCPLPDFCYKMLNEGTNFGYALCHRALLLLMARFGRGCTILSPQKDRALMTQFCLMGYAEVEFIAMNDYGNVDLMMEIMCLCSLEGHAQFLRRSWLRQILYFQKPQGCFGTEPPSKPIQFDGHSFNIKTGYKSLKYNKCDGHTTALALGTFSTAIRYIIQEFF